MKVCKVNDCDKNVRHWGMCNAHYLRQSRYGRTERKIAPQDNRHLNPLYMVWKNMNRRCYQQSNKSYKNYGGRGIKVCSRWNIQVAGYKGFDNFIADMDSRPTPQHTIERINNDGNYEPSNCKWATRIEQNNNRSTKRLIHFHGKMIPLSQLAELKNINYKTAWARYVYMKRNPDVY